MRTYLLLLSIMLFTGVSAQTWTQQTSNTTADLAEIHFYDQLTGIAIGSGGTVVSTNDGGTTWTPSDAGSDFDVLCAAFVGNSIYAAGEMVSTGEGFVIKSENKGQTWVPVATGLSERILGISFTDDTHGWIGGRKGLLQKTSDGGQTWNDGNAPSGEDILEVFFISEDQGWISVEDGLIYYTENGGTTWTNQSTGINRDLYAIYFINATQGFTTGKDGNILVFSSGSGNWVGQTSNTQEDLTDIQMLNASEAWAAGTGGVIVNSTDGGTNWTLGGDPSFGELSSISMISDTLGWVCGAAGVIAKLSSDTAGGGGGNLQAAFTVDSDVCIGEEVTFTDNSQGNAVAWTWDFGDGSANVQIQNPTHTYNQTGQFTVTLTIEDAQGNTDQSQEIINVHPEVTANFSMSLDTINLNKGNSVLLTNQSTNEDTYQWDFGNGNTSQFENPTALYSNPGTYVIQLIASNAGCEDQAEQTIVVINPTGINFLGEIDVRLFPNPANGFLVIESAGNITKVAMMNILGEMLYLDRFNPVQQKRIELSSYPAGIYLVTVETNAGQVTKRIKVSR